MSAFQVELHQDLAAIEALAPAWRQLSAGSPTALPFNDVNWVLAFWRHLARPGFVEQPCTPCVVTVHDHGRLAGIAALRIETRTLPGTTVRVARWLAEGPSDYGDLLLERPSPVLVDALLEPLLQGPQACELLDLRECRGDSPVLPLLRTVLQQRCTRLQDTPDSDCRVVPAAASYTAYAEAQFSGKRRKDFRREWRRLQEDGRYACQMRHRLPDVGAWAAEAGDVQASHPAAGRDRPGEFNHLHFSAFLRELLRVGGERGWLRAAELRCEGRLDAYFLSWAYRGRYYVYNTAHRSEVQAVGGGKLVMLYMLQQLIDEGGGPVDFLRGAEAYKEVLSDAVVRNRRLQAVAPGARAAWAAKWWLDWLPRSAATPGRRDRVLQRLGRQGLQVTLADSAARLCHRLQQGVRCSGPRPPPE